MAKNPRSEDAPEWIPPRFSSALKAQEHPLVWLYDPDLCDDNSVVAAPSVESMSRLAHHPEMQPVWDRLYSRCKDDVDRYFILEMILGISSWAPSWREYPGAQLTPAEHERAYTAFADSIDRLIDDLDKMGIDESAEICPDPAPDDELDNYRDTLRSLLGLPDSFEIDDETMRQCTSFRGLPVRSALAFVARSFRGEFLARPPVRQPRGANPDLHYAIHTLASAFRFYFGTPLHETVAVIVSVHFDMSVDADRVRMLVKSRQRKHPISEP